MPASVTPATAPLPPGGYQRISKSLSPAEGLELAWRDNGHMWRAEVDFRGGDITFSSSRTVQRPDGSEAIIAREVQLPQARQETAALRDAVIASRYLNEHSGKPTSWSGPSVELDASVAFPHSSGGRLVQGRLAIRTETQLSPAMVPLLRAVRELASRLAPEVDLSPT